jgi:hypothetical protein
MAQFRERVKRRLDPAELLAEKLEQLADIRIQMWDAWERSKENAETNVAEEELRKVYEEFTDGGGKVTRQVVGESMQLVKKMQKIAGRLPEDRYIAKIIDCLKEESRLLGLTEDAIIKVTNTTNNVAGDQNNLTVNWSSLKERPGVPDAVEGAIEAVGLASTPMPPMEVNFLDTGKLHLVKEQPVGEWSEAEIAALDDEPEHLNGDG